MSHMIWHVAVSSVSKFNLSVLPVLVYRIELANHCSLILGFAYNKVKFNWPLQCGTWDPQLQMIITYVNFSFEGPTLAFNIVPVNNNLWKSPPFRNVLRRFDWTDVKDKLVISLRMTSLSGWWETLLLLLWIIFFYSNAFSKHELPSLQTLFIKRVATKR